MKKKQSKESIVLRLKTIEGHLKKITTMVQEGTYCMDVLQQTTAVKNAIKKVEALLLDEHLHSCVIKDIKAGKQKAVNELVTLFEKINK